MTAWLKQVGLSHVDGCSIRLSSLRLASAIVDSCSEKLNSGLTSTKIDIFVKAATAL